MAELDPVARGAGLELGETKKPLIKGAALELQEVDLKVLEDEEDKTMEYKDYVDGDERFTWDLVMVFNLTKSQSKIKVYNEKKEKVSITQERNCKRHIAHAVGALRKAGINTDLFYSVQEDEVYVRLGCSESRLQKMADDMDYDLMLQPDAAKSFAEDKGIRLAKAAKEHSDLSENMWEYLYGPFDNDEESKHLHDLFVRYENPNCPHHKNSFFSSVDRIKITWAIIELDERRGGAGLSPGKLISSDHPMIACFPLHDVARRNEVYESMTRNKSTFKAPVNQIRSYFGEKIAYYFAFLAFYNRALLPVAITGIFFFIWQLVEGRVDIAVSPVFGGIIALWATMFLEVWKRKEMKYRIRWGMSSFLEKEQPRPEFRGEWKPSPVTGQPVEVFPFYKRVWRMMLSQGVIVTLIGVVIVAVFGIFLFRTVSEGWFGSFGGYVSGVVNAIQIILLNYVYSLVAEKLNEYENHRTDTAYENAMIAKTFIFRFVNSYNSLFYIAFLKKSVDGCGEDGKETGESEENENHECLYELTQQLSTIFIASIIINNTIEVLTPTVKRWRAARANRQMSSSDTEKPKTVAEEEFEKSPYESTFDDFDELVIQFGYVTLFVVAFPLAPLFALLNNVVETKIDAKKICHLSRRPEPKGAANIGTWYGILNVMSVLAVITNVALVCFSTNLLEFDWGMDAAGRAWAFIISEHVLLMLKFSIAFFVPDEPEAFKAHLARQEHIVNIFFKNMVEEEEDEDVFVMGERIRRVSITAGDNFNWSRVSDTMMKTGHEST